MKRLICTFILLALITSPLMATRATVSSSRSSFRACYLTSKDMATNLAILYKGAQLELIEQASNGRWQVRVNTSSELVVPYGRAQGEMTGWIAERFVKKEESETTPSSEDNGTNGDVDLLGQVSDPNGQSNTNTTPEATSTEGAGVYYLFTSEGNDSEWFDFLASNGQPAGKPNNVWRLIRKDIQATGHKCEGVAVIRVAKPREVIDVLAKGKIPTNGLSPVPVYSRVPIHALSELQPSEKKIIGYGIVAHSGSEGPLLNYGASRNEETGALVGLQLNWTFFREDMLKSGEKTLGKRLLDKAHIRLFGCNSGHCGYWKGRPSICHHLAAVYQEKNAVVSGKLASGSPNASGSWASFGLNSAKMATRLTPGKKEYKLLINRPKAYDRFEVPAKDDEEREAILEYYRSRDITVHSRENGVAVRAPSSKWLTRKTKKDNLLKTVVLAMSSGDEAVLAEAKAKMPHMAKFFDNTSLQNAINEVKTDNDGNLDIDDGRIWFQVYYWTLEKKQRKWKCALRNCYCQDQHITEDWKTKSKDSRRRAVGVHSD